MKQEDLEKHQFHCQECQQQQEVPKVEVAITGAFVVGFRRWLCQLKSSLAIADFRRIFPL